MPACLPAHLVSPRPLVPPCNLQGLHILTNHQSAAGIDFVACENTERPPRLGELFWPQSDRMPAA